MLRYDRHTKPGLVALYDIRPGNGAALAEVCVLPSAVLLSVGLYTLCSRLASFAVSNHVSHMDSNKLLACYLAYKQKTVDKNDKEQQNDADCTRHRKRP